MGGFAGLSTFGKLFDVGFNTINNLAQGWASRFYRSRDIADNVRLNTQLMRNQTMFQNQQTLSSPLLAKMGAKNAGMSTADPTGSGAQLSTASMPSQSLPANTPLSNMDSLASGISALSGSRLAESQARLNDIEAKYKDDFYQLTNDNIAAAIALAQSNKDLTDEQKKEVTAKIDNLKVEYDNLLKSGREIEQNIKNLAIKYDLDKQLFDFNNEYLPLQLKLVCEQIYQAHSAGLLNEAQTKQAMEMAANLAAQTKKISAETEIIQGQSEFLIAKAEIENKNAFQELRTAEALADYNKRLNSTWGELKGDPLGRYQKLMRHIGEFTGAFGNIFAGSAGYAAGQYSGKKGKSKK